MSEKPSNTKGESNKDLDDLLDSEFCEINMNFQNYISGSHTIQYHDRIVPKKTIETFFY